MTLVTPRNVKSVSCVTRISHESHFACQAQHLVTLVAPRLANEYFVVQGLVPE